ncbi:MAG: DNA polymerase III subunit delta [Acholeplasmatales bacterium]|nr:DNA polymerase III subunit delta [Acholeplasmatales bacterium]
MYNYLISSDDIEALNDKILEINNSYKLDFDVIRYDLEDDDIYSIIDDVSTISLFDNPKFIIVKSANNIASASEKKVTELLKALNDKDSNNVVVFTEMDKLDLKDDNISRLKKYCIYFDIRIKNIPLDEYAKNYLKKNEYEIDEQALVQLIKYSVNMANLKNNLDILISFKADTKKISVMDVTNMVKQPLDDNIYSLIDMVLNNNKKAIFKIYNDFRIENIAPTFIISMLLNKFQEMYDVYVLVKGGADQQSIINLFNVSNGKAYYMIKNSKQVSIEEIKRNLDELINLDYNIKSGKVDQYLGLELYLLR